MVSASRACAVLLDTLGPEDRFAIEAFENTTSWMVTPSFTSQRLDRLQPVATKTVHSQENTDATAGFFLHADEAAKQRGKDFLKTIEAMGGTELGNAVDQAIGVRSPAGT